MKLIYCILLHLVLLSCGSDKEDGLISETKWLTTDTEITESEANDLFQSVEYTNNYVGYEYQRNFSAQMSGSGEAQKLNCKGSYSFKTVVMENSFEELALVSSDVNDFTDEGEFSCLKTIFMTPEEIDFNGYAWSLPKIETNMLWNSDCLATDSNQESKYYYNQVLDRLIVIGRCSDNDTIVNEDGMNENINRVVTGSYEFDRKDILLYKFESVIEEKLSSDNGNSTVKIIRKSDSRKLGKVDISKVKLPE